LSKFSHKILLTYVLLGAINGTTMNMQANAKRFHVHITLQIEGVATLTC